MKAIRDLMYLMSIWLIIRLDSERAEQMLNHWAYKLVRDRDYEAYKKRFNL